MSKINKFPMPEQYYIKQAEHFRALLGPDLTAPAANGRVVLDGTDPAVNFRAVCGTCNFPASQHTDRVRNQYIWSGTYPGDMPCRRSAESIGSYAPDVTELFDEEGPLSFDYEDNYQSIVRYDGPGLDDDEKYDRWAVNPDLIESDFWERLDAYRDQGSGEYDNKRYWDCTMTLEQMQYCRSQNINANEVRWTVGERITPTSYSESATDNRTVSVEGDASYSSVKVLDLDLTERYQLRLLNVYRSKHNGNLRVGGIEIADNTDGSITAKCSRYDCTYIDANGNKQRCALTIKPDTATREEMEEFVLAVIRHGNNHGPQWLVQREDFYLIGESLPAKDQPKNKSTMSIVMDHARACVQKDCACGPAIAEYLKAKLTPA